MEGRSRRDLEEDSATGRSRNNMLRPSHKNGATRLHNDVSPIQHIENKENVSLIEWVNVSYTTIGALTFHKKARLGIYQSCDGIVTGSRRNIINNAYCT